MRIRKTVCRLVAIGLMLAAGLAVTTPGARAATIAPDAPITPAAAPPDGDWSKALVESTMKRFTPQTLGGRGSLPDNWTETSCSSMYTFVISRAAQRGYVNPLYNLVAARGYNGVMKKVTLNADGLTDVADICIGTNVADLTYYLTRPRMTNDLHGLGSFLIMNEQLRARHWAPV